MKILLCVLCVVTVVYSNPVTSKEDPVIGFIDEAKSCVNQDDAVSCLKEQALGKVEELESARSLKLFSGVTLLNNSPRKSRSLEPLSTDDDVRKKQVTNRLWKSVTDLLENGEIELSYGVDGDEEAESRAVNDVDEGRGKKKKKIKKKKLKALIPLVLLAKAKAVAIAVVSLLIIAASLFKLALLAKVAFIIKIIAIIKALLAKKHQTQETYEIVQSHGWEPHVEHHVDHHHVEHDHGGWSRSLIDGDELAYSAYAN